MIRVLIADDHGVVRAGIRHLLMPDPEIEVVAEALDGDQVIAILERVELPIDVLILDILMSGATCIEVLHKAAACRPRLATLVHSMYAEAQYGRRLIAEGAAGYLCKDRSDGELLDAVRTVARGRIYATRRYHAPKVAMSGHECLSARELQVFMLLATGQSVSGIANELSLRVSTVSTYVGKIRAKLGVQTIGEIVSYAHRHRLVT